MHPGCTLTQVYLCRHPVDFRKSIDGLSALVEQELELNPFGSALYVFINRQKDKLKALYWQRVLPVVQARGEGEVRLAA
jgi:transposase